MKTNTADLPNETTINNSQGIEMSEKILQLQPLDEHNQKLESNVHPPEWKNPTPSGDYHLVVIGAGTAGLVLSLIHI